MTEEQIRQLIRQTIDGKAVDWAREIGVSPSYLSDVLTGRRAPGEKILAPLGLRRVVTYERVAG